MTAEDIDVVMSAVAPVMREIIASRVDAIERVVGPTGDRGPKGEDGEPGRDADPSVVTELLQQVGALQAEVGSLTAKLASAETRLSEFPAMLSAAIHEAISKAYVPKDGKDGADGTSVDVNDLVPIIAVEVSKAVALLPPAQDGKPGESVSVKDVDALVVQRVDKAVAAISRPVNGKDGEGVTVDDVWPLIAAEVSRAAALIPVPKDGEPGAPGADGKPGQSVSVADVDALVTARVEKAVASIPVPKDGIGVVGALVGRDGHLIVTLSDGSVKDVGTVVGRDVDMGEVTRAINEELAKWPRPIDGLNGKDGRDGLGLDDLHFVHDEHGRLTARFERGDVVKSGLLPSIVDRGVYKADASYLKGDGVTWSGSFWIAQQDTNAKPGEISVESRAWRLAVKAGRDGKAGAPGAKGIDGKDGRPGHDLTVVPPGGRY